MGVCVCVCVCVCVDVIWTNHGCVIIFFVLCMWMLQAHVGGHYFGEKLDFLSAKASRQFWMNQLMD